ncbi:Ku protein [Chromohalobacter canadensis]|uniref:non-homologous end joining protein Ku n=1 Tax=Chromohalobacter canadensis TaxID=141389 RepID=UPI00240EC075|nr:Ku protein [Chromohalobacter canadensis]
MPKRDNNSSFRGPRPFWSGIIAFGLVNLPVGLYPAHHSRDVTLREVDEEGTPLARRYFSERGRKPLKSSELARGVEVADGRYVVVEEQEIEDAAVEHRREIELSRFVSLEELDPLYFRQAYFLVPDKGALKPYKLLAEAMEKTRRAGIATLVMRGREVLVAILAEGGILRAEALRFHDELRSPESIGLEEPGQPTPKREQQMRKAMDKLNAKTFDPDELIDPHMEALQKRVRQKRRRHEDTVFVEDNDTTESNNDEDGAEVIDLMQVLKRSLTRGRAAPSDNEHRQSSAKDSASKGASSRRKSASQSLSGTSEDLKKLTREALYERAQALEIAERSKMNKAQLIKAIQQQG